MNEDINTEKISKKEEMSEKERLQNTFPEDINFEQVIRILSLIKEKPNRRDSPDESDLPGNFTFWFEGGAAIEPTGGGTTYYFKDGAQAHQPYPWEPGYPNIYIKLSDGRKIKIEVIEQNNEQNVASKTLSAESEVNSDDFTDSEVWFCINCGSKGGEESVCKNCNINRLNVEETITLKVCKNCSRSNLMVAKFCAWCGEDF